MNRWILTLVKALGATALVLFLNACSSDPEPDSGSKNPPPSAATFILSGSIANLVGEELALLLTWPDGTEPLTPGQGDFNFTTRLEAGTEYSVEIATQPADQVCSFSNGSDRTNSVISATPADNTLPAISCEPTFLIDGTLSGLTGTDNGLELTLTWDDKSEVLDAIPGGSTAFNFEARLKANTEYTVTITNQPENQVCRFDDESESVDKTISASGNTLPAISCETTFLITASINGLTGADNGLELTLTWDDKSEVMDAIPAGNTTFNFAARLKANTNYNVAITEQPQNQFCHFDNDTNSTSVSQTVTDSDNTLPAITCQAGFTIGGTVYDRTGLSGELQLTLTLNGSTVTQQALVPGSSTGPVEFEFSLGVEPDSEFTVSVTEQPPGETCVFGENEDAPTSFQGTVTDRDVDDLELYCRVNPPELTLTPKAIKTFSFSWEPVPNATYYQLLEDVDGTANAHSFEPVSDDIPAGIGSDRLHYDLTQPLYARLNAQYQLRSCTQTDDCTTSKEVSIDLSAEQHNHLISGIGYLKASNTGPGDSFGYSVSLNKDGTVLAIGAPYEDSNFRGIDNRPGLPNLDRGGANGAGAVYLFRKDDNGWHQQAYLKAHNADAFDHFGEAVALNAAGTLLAVGAPGEDSERNGIVNTATGGSDNAAENAGAVYLFALNNENQWQQTSYVKAFNSGKEDSFGKALALNEAGTKLVVGAPYEDSKEQGTTLLLSGSNAGENNEDPDSGAVYVFAPTSEEKWTNEFYIKGSRLEVTENDHFGGAVSLNAAGNVLAVGAEGFDSKLFGTTLFSSGAAYIYQNVDTPILTWIELDRVEAEDSEKQSFDRFGYSVSLDDSGTLLAVGAPASDRSAVQTGSVYLFSPGDGVTYSKQKKFLAPNNGREDEFGHAVSLSGDGQRLVIGARLEDSDTNGVRRGKVTEGDFNNAITNPGGSYIYHRNGASWDNSLESFIKAPNTGPGDQLGFAVSISRDGKTVAIGAHREQSAARGVGGDQPLADGLVLDNPQADNTMGEAGAVYLY